MSFHTLFLFVCCAFRKSDVDAEPEGSPGSSSSSSSNSRSGVDALSSGAAPAQASAGELGQRGDSSCSDSFIDSSSSEEEDKEADPAMFSSKFLSGANPLNAMSSAVNKFGLFGDDGEADKKSSPQQRSKASGEPQPGPGPAKNSQKEQAPQKSSKGPLMLKSQPLPKQGPPEQTAPPTNKPTGQQAKAPPQQGSPKPGTQPVSPKLVPPKMKEEQDPTKGSVQKQGLVKTGAQGPKKAGSELGSQQLQTTKTRQQKEDSPKVEQKGLRNQISDRQKGIKGPGKPEGTPVGSPSLTATKAIPQSKAISKPLCSVCNTTELNIHTKDPPNYKTCTQCKTDVCSLCGFSPPDADVSSEAILFEMCSACLSNIKKNLVCHTVGI